MSEADRVPVDHVAARTIGLVADTHSRQRDGSDLPAAVLDALRGVDLILHLGDMGAVGALDRLAQVAPVLATRGGHAVGEDPRIAARARVVVAGGRRVGALFDLSAAGAGFTVTESIGFPPESESALARLFGAAVDVVAFAATHRPFLVRHQGVLYVNPGSPNLPAAGPGTVAVLDLSAPEPGAVIREVGVAPAR
jgi:putative phosphoesterase